MANDLRFGVQIDLEQAIKEASGNADKYLRRLQDALNKRAINVRVNLGGSTRGSSTELVGFKKQLAELTQQWNALTAAERGSAAGAAIREKFRALRSEAQGYTSTLQAAVNAEDKLHKTQNKTAASTRNLGKEYHTTSTYLSRLIQRLAVYQSVSYVGGFLTQVREVTAQFELQRISLGAIIQDQAKANQLFSEIKNFALKSPVKILDLTKYTKQLAAYRIETDKLFDTTKRLADISVGIGISMDRLILLYGQVRATGYLRASEVRQATEAGIPLVEELAKKLSAINGELVKSADVMDMISKREIPFELVAEVFQDMTDKGGIFYNMQEIQGNTLYGLWQKLGDAAAVMYDQIGNTSSVNEGMKMAIQTLRYLMLHWKQVGIVVGGVSTYLIANVIATKNAVIATAAATAANKLHVVSLQQKLGALKLEQMSLKSTHILQRLYTAATISATKAQIGAATSTNVFSKALYGLKAALLSNPLTALAVALTTIIALLMQSESELDKLNSKLQDIDRDYDASGQKSVERFKELVKAVEENVDGSKAQKEALDELDRTYSKILGSEALELDSLKAMGGQYGELIDMINAYNAVKKGEERKTAIESASSTIIEQEKDDLKDFLNQMGMPATTQIAFIDAINEKVLEGKDAITATNEAFKEFADEMSEWDSAGNFFNVFNPDKLFDRWGVFFRWIGGAFGGQGMNYLYNYALALERQNVLLDENEKKTRLEADALGKYSVGVDNLNKSFANLDWSSMEALYTSLQDYNAKHPENMISVPIDLSFDPAKAENEYDKLLETSNMKIYAIFSVLRQIAQQEGQTIPEEFYKQAQSVVDGNKDFSFIDWAKLEEQFKNSPKALAAIRASKQLYESIAPSDETIRVFNRKFMSLADSMDVSLDKMQEYLMRSGDNLGDHRKKLSDEVTNLLKTIARLEWTKKMLSMFGLPANAVEAKIAESKQILELLQSMIADIPDIEGIGEKSKSGGRKSDNRLSQLREIEQTLTTINSKYEELLKKEGQTKALADIQKIYGDTLKYINKLGRKFKLNFAMPTEFKTLQDYRKAIQDVIEKLKMKGYEKAALELQTKIDTGDVDKLGKEVEAKIKQLSDRISRTKTAREFYDKVLGMTGDVELAAKVSMSIYGDTGFDLQKQLADQIRQYFQNDSIKVGIPIDVITPDNQINYKKLGELAEKYKTELGEKPYEEIKKIAEQGQKDLAKTYEGYFKDLEKAKTYASQRIELAQTTANKIRQIRADMASGRQPDKAVGESLVSGLIDKEMKEAAKLEWEAFKGTPLYTQMFEDLEHASTSTLEMMRSRLEALSRTWGSALDPTQLKEMQSRMNEITDQLRDRNPWKQLKEAYRQYKDATDSVTFTGAVNKSGEAAKSLYDATKIYGADSVQAKAAMQELKAREKIVDIVKQITAEQGKQVKGQKALTLAQQKAFDNEKIARGHLGIAAAELKKAEDKATAEGKDPANDPEVKAKREALKLAEEQLDIAERVSAIFIQQGKSIAKRRETMASVASSITQGMQIGADLAKDIADTMEALGGNEDDVQYWNDIATALGDITAGFQGLVDSALALNVGGIISNAIGIIPNMVKGFSGLFSAGKVKRANKEIKRQQELLDQLEYSYSRLEKAAEKVFGLDYINNFKRQQKNLEAQARAYQAMAAAERSKGKKADEDKIKEYENSYRETMDEIADMQGQIAAQMLGTDLTSAARDFAKAWLDAYKEFGNTADKMSEKFHEMIENMVVEGVLAKVMERALKPAFDMIDDMKDTDFYTETFWRELVSKAEQGAKNADAGARTMMSFLEQAGITVRGLGGELTGITREIAGASEETMNGVAAALNTQNYYVSHVPVISEHVAAIRMLMEGGEAQPRQGGIDTTALWNQHLELQQGIYRHTAETASHCERIAARCESMASDLRRVIGSVPSEGSGLRVWINGR